MSKTDQKIYESLGLIMAEIEPIAKGRSSSLNFSFRGIEDVMNALHALFKKHGVVVSTEIINHECEQVTSAKGALGYHHLSRIAFDFVSTKDGSSHRIISLGESIDYGDKGATKTISISLKYALCNLFLIPTAETAAQDPDAHGHDLVRKPKPPKANKGTAQELKDKIADHFEKHRNDKWFEIPWPTERHEGKTLGDVAVAAEVGHIQSLREFCELHAIGSDAIKKLDLALNEAHTSLAQTDTEPEGGEE